MVPGWAAGGGHSAARRRRPDARLAASTPASSRPTPTSARFDGGFGSAYLARQVGQKFAREIFFLGDEYTAEDAHRMGMVNARRRPRRPGAGRARVGAQDQRQVAHRAADAEVLLQPDRRRAGRPAAVRRRDHPAGLHDRRGASRAATRSWRSASPTGRRTPGTTDRVRLRRQRLNGCARSDSRAMRSASTSSASTRENADLVTAGVCGTVNRKARGNARSCSGRMLRPTCPAASRTLMA